MSWLNPAPNTAGPSSSGSTPTAVQVLGVGAYRRCFVSALDFPPSPRANIARHRPLTCLFMRVSMCVCVIVPPNADTTLAREYDLEITSQFVPLGVYTLEVDYTNIDVQVKGEIKGRDRYAMGGPSSARRQRRLKNTLPAITTVLFFSKMLRSAGSTLTLYIRAINTTGTLFKMLHLPLSGSGANARDRRTHGRAAARLGTPRLVAVLVHRVGCQRHEVQVRRLAATVDAPCSESLFRLPLGDLYRRR